MSNRLTHEELEKRIKELEHIASEYKKREQLILDSIAYGFWEYDFKNNVFIFNDKMFTMLGYPPMNNGHGYEFLTSIIHPEDRDIFEESHKKLIDDKEKNSQFTFRLKAADGSWHYILYHSNCVAYDENGFGYHYMGTHSDITEYKQTEEELRVNVVKYKTVFEALPVGVTISDTNGNIVESNDASEQILGISKQEHAKRKIGGKEWILLREDCSIMPPEEFASTRALKENHLIENVIMGIDKGENNITWLNVCSAPIPLEEYGVVIVYNDITERKNAEVQYFTLFNEMLDAFALHEIILDENGNPADYKFLKVNPAFENMTGLKSEDIIGKTVMETLSATEKYWIEIYGRVVTTGEPALFENYSKELDKYFEIKAFRTAPGQFVCIFSDITDRRIGEATIRESEKKYRNISTMLRLMCDNMPTMIWAKDLQKRYIFVNKAICRDLLSAVDTYEPIGKTDIFFAQRERAKYPDNPKWHNFGEICRDTDLITMDAGKPMQFDEYGNVQGKFMFLDVHKAPFIDENGIMIGTVGSAINITEYKEAESQIRQLQKTASLGYMAGGIAHLFNNYLYIVSGNLELALESIPEDSVVRGNIVEAMSGTYRCADVSGAMLTYLGQNFTKSEPINISEVCRNSLSEFGALVHNEISIQTDLIDNEIIVNANAGQMKEVLIHLIKNAYESIGENRGVIHLNTKIVPASDISNFHILPVDSKPSLDRYACLEVSDTGCGIPKKDIYELADPFFTTKFAGRGLGLAVVLGIVKSWGGMIGISSEIGLGSSFMILLPLSM